MEIFGGDPICTSCRLYEWQHMQQQQVNVLREKQAINECNIEYWRKRRRMAALVNGVKLAAILLLLLAFMANVPNALHYEQTKYQRAIEHDAR